MASVSKDGKGWRVLFYGPDGARKTVRLGRVDRRVADAIRCHVEALLVAKVAGVPVRQETAVWLANIGETLRDKLARVGLIDAKPVVTVGAYLQKWLAARRGDYKPASLIAWGQVVAALTKFLGADSRLEEVTAAQAEAFRQSMVASGLRATTIHKRLQHARLFFAHAQRQGLIATNPFEHVRHRPGDAKERRAYVPAGDVVRLMDYAPNNIWRLLIALSRFAGLYGCHPKPSRFVGPTWTGSVADWWCPAPRHSIYRAGVTE